MALVAVDVASKDTVTRLNSYHFSGRRWQQLIIPKRWKTSARRPESQPERF
jgi:hypothetical protein